MADDWRYYGTTGILHPGDKIVVDPVALSDELARSLAQAWRQAESAPSFAVPYVYEVQLRGGSDDSAEDVMVQVSIVSDLLISGELAWRAWQLTGPDTYCGTREVTSTVIQMREAVRLRKAWEAKGSPPCNHPDTDREYDLGSHTGDRVCLTCGQTFAPDEWAALQGNPPSAPA